MSTMLVMVSAPITSTMSCSPETMAELATDRAYTKPEQPAFRSSAPAWMAPRAFCTRQAVEGTG